MQTPSSPPVPLREIAALFLKLGIIGFGGPAAHIALMRQEVVEKRRWLDEQGFLDLLGAVHLIPGPNSTELAIHIGYEKGGWRGLLLAGLCFILPAVAITAVIAWLYRAYGTLPQVQPFVYGAKPAVLAVVVAAVFPLARASFKAPFLIGLGVLVLGLSLLGVPELYLLFGAGFLAVLRHRSLGRQANLWAWPLLAWVVPPLMALFTTRFFFLFLKIGALLYGSGYVLFALLDEELVATGLLERQVLIDAVAVGQFTPGPVFSAVTFIGFQMDGWKGAALATLGVFLPSFVLVALLKPLVSALRGPVFAAFLDAVNAASVALIAVVCLQMGRESVFDGRTVLIAGLSLCLAFGFRRLNSAFVVALGAGLGWVLAG